MLCSMGFLRYLFPAFFILEVACLIAVGSWLGFAHWAGFFGGSFHGLSPVRLGQRMFARRRLVDCSTGYTRFGRFFGAPGPARL